MSGAPAASSYREVGRPGARTKVIAVLVVIALAGLAAYAVFAPPTRVHVSGGAQTTPTRTTPAPPPAEPERDRGERGD
jgi:hypothetical protein